MATPKTDKLTWTTKLLPVDKLINWKGNARIMTQDDLDDLEMYISKHGLARSLTVSPVKGKWEVIGGNQTLVTIKKLGYKEAPCTIPNRPLTEPEKREISLILNHRNKGEGTPDFEMLTEWKNEGMDFEIIGIEFPISPDNFGTDFTLPSGDKAPFQQMTFTLADAQAELIQRAIKEVNVQDGTQYGNENSNGNALHQIVLEWDAQRK
jgi:hypothetical protein